MDTPTKNAESTALHRDKRRVMKRHVAKGFVDGYQRGRTAEVECDAMTSTSRCEVVGDALMQGSRE